MYVLKGVPLKWLSAINVCKIYIKLIVYKMISKSTSKAHFQRFPSFNFIFSTESKGDLVFIHLPDWQPRLQDCERLWWGEDGILSGSSRPAEPRHIRAGNTQCFQEQASPTKRYIATGWQHEHDTVNMLIQISGLKGVFFSQKSIWKWDKVNASADN